MITRYTVQKIARYYFGKTARISKRGKWTYEITYYDEALNRNCKADLNCLGYPAIYWRSSTIIVDMDKIEGQQSREEAGDGRE